MKTAYIYIGVAVVVVLIIVIAVLRRRPKKLNNANLSVRWQDVQKRCANKKEWHLAVIDADKLLDDVLRHRRYKGKTTGERLVRAQHTLTDNESVWFGHKLRNRIVQEDVKKLSKQDTLEALSGFRQALKDLGALQEPKQEISEDGDATS